LAHGFFPLVQCRALSDRLALMTLPDRILPKTGQPGRFSERFLILKGGAIAKLTLNEHRLQVKSVECPVLVLQKERVRK
jgi:hypothetical protein